MAWWVFNDAGNIHNLYNGDRIGIEVQQSCFGFDIPHIGLDQTLFEHYKLVYRGSNTLDSTSIGIFTDFDLGFFGDDYLGCDPSQNLFYCYNGDDNDEGATGYGTVTPALGMKILEGIEDDTKSNVRLSKFMYFENSFNSSTSDPQTDTELYRYLNGGWKDGRKLSYGGTGYSSSNTDYADFAFPGTKDPKGRAEWSEKTAGNTPGDRRALGSMGPIKLIPGAVCDFTIGIPFVQGGTSEESLIKLLEVSQAQQEFFDSNFDLSNIKTVAYWQNTVNYAFEGEKKTVIVALNTTPTQDITLNIVPDNSKGTLAGDAIFTPSTITFKKGEPITKEIEVEAVAGKLSNKPYRVLHYKLELANSTPDVTIDWCNLAFGVYAQAKPINTVNGVDANGSPLKLNEFVAVRGLAYGAFTRKNTNITIADGTGGIAVDFQDKVKPGDFLVIDFPNTSAFIELWVYGKVTELNGVTTIISEDYVVLPAKNRKTVTAIISVTEVHESDLVVFKNCSVVDDAEWKSNNNLTMLNFGTRFTNGKDTILVKYQELTSGITPPKNVDIYGVGYQYDETSPYTSNRMLRVPHKSYIVPAGTLSVHNTLSSSNVKVYPNPVTAQLTIATDDGNLKTVRIYGINGNKVFEQTQLITRSITLNTADYLQAGMYVIEITNTLGATTTKKIVVN